MRRRLNRKRRGVTLAEVIVSTMLIGLLLCASLASVAATARTTSMSAAASDGLALARALFDEITRLPYEDGDQTPLFGLETGESGLPGERNFCDDLDDFKDWVDSPPKDRAGVAISGYAGWQRTADVQKINDSDYKLLNDDKPDKGLRLVTVSVISPTGAITQLAAYRTKDGGVRQSQGVGQSLVTWVGLSLQSGAGSPIAGGASLVNHASDQ